jgi:hypothetical protein
MTGRLLRHRFERERAPHKVALRSFEAEHFAFDNAKEAFVNAGGQFLFQVTTRVLSFDANL